MSICIKCNTIYTQKNRLQAPAYEPTAYLNSSTGYAFLCQKYPEETPRFKQVAFPVADLEATLDRFYTDPGSVGLRPGCDTYISQGIFAGKGNRLATSCISLSAVWLELDLTKAGFDPLATLPAIEARRIEAGLPPFSKINFSGHGLHCKYVFTDAISPAQFAAWSELIASLAAVFAGFGVDTSVFDTARVLRLPDTLNTEAGLYCRAIQDSGDRYDFNDLCAILAPFKPAAEAAAATPKAPARHLRIVESKSTRAAIHRPALPTPRPKLRLYKNPRVDWDATEWSRLVLADLVELMSLRFPGGILPPGERDELLFPAFVYLAHYHEGDHTGFLNAARELCRRHCDWSDGDFENCISSLAKKHRLDCAGEPAGALACHVYTYKASTLIERLNISIDEQLHLRALISEDGRRERNRRRQEANRRAAGAIERGTYLETAATRRDQARQLAQEGHSADQIAHALGVSKRSVYNYLAESRAAVQGPCAYAVAGSGGEGAVESLPGTASGFQTQESAQPAFVTSPDSPAQERPAAIREQHDQGERITELATGSYPQAPGITPLSAVDLIAQAAVYWAEVARCCFIEQQAEEAREAWLNDFWGDTLDDIAAQN